MVTKKVTPHAIHSLNAGNLEISRIVGEKGKAVACPAGQNRKNKRGPRSPLWPTVSSIGSHRDSGAIVQTVVCDTDVGALFLRRANFPNANDAAPELTATPRSSRHQTVDRRLQRARRSRTQACLDRNRSRDRYLRRLTMARVAGPSRPAPQLPWKSYLFGRANA